jgi:YD repeat-containing protein
MAQGNQPFDFEADDIESLNQLNIINNSINYVFPETYNLMLKGKVKIINNKEYRDVTEKFGEIVINESKLKEYTFEFNRQGKFNRITSNKGKGTSITRFIYDSEGKIVEIQGYRNDTILKRSYFFYDSNELLNKQDRYEGITLISRFTYKYDDANHPIELNQYHGNGNLLQRINCNYEQNLMKEMVTIRVNGASNEVEKSTVINYKYDSKGTIIMRDEMTKEELLDSYTRKKTEQTNTSQTYTYDANGYIQSYVYRSQSTTIYPSKDCDGYNKSAYGYELNQKGECVYKSKKYIRETNYKYDNEGRVKEAVSTDGTYRIYTYDNFGRLIYKKEKSDYWIEEENKTFTEGNAPVIEETIHYSAEGILESIYKQEYIYDENGNYVSEKFFKDGKVLKLTKRNIVYY